MEISDVGYAYMKNHNSLKVTTLMEMANVLDVSITYFFKENNNEKLLKKAVKNTDKILELMKKDAKKT